MKSFLTLVRWIVGVLFIFSGLIKANDPLGLSYKMQEFFEVWGLHGLDGITLSLSVLMIAFEIIAGVAVLVGWQMKLFSWLLLLLIIFFTFLTAYAQFSGKIKTCGCFGDCIPLTSLQSFWKDVILTILIVFIFIFRKQVKPALGTAGSLIVLVFSVIASFGLQWYVLRHLPILDCLPYKTGKNISEGMKVPPGAIPDSIVISFVYNKGGKELEFTADQFPADFDESVYHFVKRYDKVVRKGNAEPAIKDFALYTLGGTDSTQAILQEPGLTILFFAKDTNTPVKDWLDTFVQMQSVAAEKHIPLYLVTADADGIIKGFEGHTLPVILKCDAVAVKTAARTNPAVYVLRQGTVLNKWGEADLNKALGTIQTLNNGL